MPQPNAYMQFCAAYRASAEWRKRGYGKLSVPQQGKVLGMAYRGLESHTAQPGRIYDGNEFTKEWKARVRPVKNLHTKHGEVIYTLDEKVFGSVSPRVGVALSSKDRGLGLYATRDMQSDELVGFFTGVWGLESDFDTVFGVEDVCISNYSASFGNKAVLPFRVGNMGKGAYTCSKGRLDRVMVMPRLSENKKDDPSTLCYVRFDYSLVDVCALMNDSRGGKASCYLSECLVETFDDDGNPIMRPLLVIRSIREVRAGTELTFDYGHKGVAKAFQGYGKYDFRKHSLDAVQIIGLIGRGKKAAQDIARLHGYAQVPEVFCGPPIYPIQCGKEGHYAIVVAQATGEDWRTFLRDAVYGGNGAASQAMHAMQDAVERNAAQHLKTAHNVKPPDVPFAEWVESLQTVKGGAERAKRPRSDPPRLPARRCGRETGKRRSGL